MSSAALISSEQSPAAEPLVWLLSAPRAGDQAQLERVAEALGWPTRWLPHRDGTPRVIRDRLRGARTAIPADRQDVYRPPWPDLVLTIGGRSIVDALRIRHASGGKARIVCLGRPWARLNKLDLVVTTPQYQIPLAPNVVPLSLPLNRCRPPDNEARRYWQGVWKGLPQPRLGVLLGGRSGSYRWTPSDVGELTRLLNARAMAAGAGVIVCGSPRTPELLTEGLRDGLTVPHRIHPWTGASSENPYSAVIRMADALVVTADSASMLAEAVSSGRPVAAFEPRLRLHTRLCTSALARTLARGWRDRLVRRGCWVPVRDMRRILQQLGEAGRLHPVDALPLDGAANNADNNVAKDEDLQAVVRAVRGLLATVSPVPSATRRKPEGG